MVVTVVVAGAGAWPDVGEVGGGPQCDLFPVYSDDGAELRRLERGLGPLLQVSKRHQQHLSSGRALTNSKSGPLVTA